MKLRFVIVLAALSTLLSGCFMHFTAFDTDNNSETGCDLDLQEVDIDQSLRGIERVALVLATHESVSTEAVSALGADTSPPSGYFVVGTALAACDEDEGDLSIIEEVEETFWPVGLNNGTNNGDVIEYAVPRSFLGGSTRMRAVTIVTRVDGNFPEVLNNRPETMGELLDMPHHTDLTQAFVINLLPISNAPTLSLGAMALLSALLFVFGRRRLTGTARSMAAVALLVSLSGIAYALTITLDGQVADWKDVPPAVNDPDDDSSYNDPGEEILAVFATSDTQNVYLRVDVQNMELTPP